MRGLILTVALCPLMCQVVWGQQPPQPPAANPQQANQPPTVTATIQEVKQKGRLKALVVANDEGQTMEITLGRIPLDIKASGDKGFIRQGAFIAAEGVLTNDMLFIQEVNVLAPHKGQKLPRGFVKKAPPRPGASQNAFQIMGTIQALQPNPDYPDYTMLALDAPGRIPVINLEKNYTVQVTSNNPDDLQPGWSVEMEGRLARNKFVPLKLTVNKPEPFKSTDYFGEAEGAESSEK